MYKQLLHITGCCLAFLAQSAIAVDGPTPPDDLFFSELPTVLTATRLSQPAENIPGPFTIIDREMIDASGAVNIADLFRLVPGFQVAHALGHRHSVATNGMTGSWPRRLLVMIDGRSVYTSLLSTVDWNDLTVELDDIERIEVFRGPNAPAYGANAFLAVINIITRLPFQDKGFFIKGMVGDIDSRYAMLRYAGGMKNYKQRVSLSYNENSGYPGDVVDDSNVGKLSYRADYTPNSRDVVELHLGYASSDNGTSYWDLNDAFNLALEPVREYQNKTHNQMIKWVRNQNTTDSLQLQFYHNHTSKTDEYIVEDPAAAAFGVAPFPAAYIHATSERYDLEASQTLQLSDELRLVWGGGLRQDRMMTKPWTDSDETFENFSKRLFSNLEYSPTPRHVFNLGLMGETSEISDATLSSRVAYNYHVDNQNTLRINATRGYRQLSLFEENLLFVIRDGNNNVIDVAFGWDAFPLHAEKITAYEIGYLMNNSSNSLQLDTSIFLHELEDLVTSFWNDAYSNPLDAATVDPGTAESATNDGHAKIVGLELQLKWHPTRQTMLNLTHSVAHMEGQEVAGIDSAGVKTFRDTGNDTSKQFTPAHTSSLLLSHSFDGGWTASGAWYRVDNMEWGDIGEPVPAYDRLDLRLAKTFNWGRSKAKLELVGQNLNQEHIEFEERSVFDRRRYIKFSMQF